MTQSDQNNTSTATRKRRESTTLQNKFADQKRKNCPSGKKYKTPQEMSNSWLLLFPG